MATDNNKGVNSLVIFQRASLMLAEADTIQKARELKSLALTAADWARRKGMGEEAIRYARSYALEAERKMGEMLLQTDRANTARDRKAELPGVTPPPTLKELGLSKKESSKAQVLAKLESESFNELKQGNKTLKDVLADEREKKRIEHRSKLAEQGRKVDRSERWSIQQADMSEWKSDRKFDWVITDPPYPKEYLPLYETLALRCQEWLKEGGLLVAMCGQSYLPEIYASLSRHLTYYWTAAYLTPGQPTPLRQVAVNTTWKPLLIFSHGKYAGKIFGDVFKSDGNEKDFHKWGQSISGMSDIISKLVLPGESVLDPFCGSGTTGIAVVKHGCFFTGLELDKDNCDIAKARLQEECQ